MRIMAKVSVVGDKDSVLAFKALGVEVFTPIGERDIAECVNNLAKEGYGVIFITESYAELIPETISKYAFLPLPSIVPIPDNQGTKGIGMAGINKNMEKAIGMNIF